MEGISLILITTVHDLYTVVFGGAQSYNVLENTPFFIISPRSLNYFWNFPRCANLRYMGHATMSMERENDPQLYFIIIENSLKRESGGTILFFSSRLTCI